MATTVQKKDERLKGAFRAAMDNLATLLGAALASKPTPISKFKASYGGVLEEADHGTVQMISQGRKHYVLLTESQLVEIMGANVHTKPRSLADTLASLTPPRERLDTSQVMLAGSAHDPFRLPDGIR